MFFCAALTRYLASADGPPPVPLAPGVLLNSYSFNDTNLPSGKGDAPRVAYNVDLVPSWQSNAVNITGSNAMLAYNETEADGHTNIVCDNGSIFLWFAPNWSSQAAGGTGPGVYGRFIELGAYTPDASYGWWSLYVDPLGSWIYFGAQTNGAGTNYFSAPINWSSNEWHFIALTYSPTNSALYLDGQSATNSFGVLYYPGSDARTNGFSIGSDAWGTNVVNGQFESLMTWNYPQSASYISNFYQTIIQRYPILPPGGGDEGGLAPSQGNGFGDRTSLDPSGSESTEATGLRLTVPRITSNILNTSLTEADTNSAYDLFQTFAVKTNSIWSLATSGLIGQTNFSLTKPTNNATFYLAAEYWDSDFDGLSDAFEEKVLHTNKLSPDSDGDGIPDGKDDANGNGIPDYIDYAGLTRVVIWASRANAYEGGQSGELTIQLPTPAPTNNTKILINLGGLADYDGDYILTKLDGTTRVTNEVFFAAGEKQQKLLVQAINDSVQQTFARKLQVSLESATNYVVDWQLAEVNIIDNDLPSVAVLATDPIAKEPVGGTNNPGAFTIYREGSTSNALSVRFSISGTATPGACYSTIASPVTIPAGSNSVVLPVSVISDDIYEGEETVILTLAADAAYVINSVSGSATVTLQDDDLPTVSMIGTDLIATEYGGPKASTVTVRRTGSTAKTLTVPLAIAGTASNGVDYVSLPQSVTFSVGSSNAVLNVTPIADGLEEQVETVILSIKGGLSYKIGASNSVTVIVDDSSATRYETVQLKSASVYSLGTIDSPAIFEVHRFGRSSSAVNIPFQIKTNASGGSVDTTWYRMYGDAGGTQTAPYAIFGAYAPKATLKFTAPQSVSAAGGGVNLLIPSVGSDYWAIWYQPNYTYAKFEIVSTNAVEGQGAQGRIRFTRLQSGPQIDLPLVVSGRASPGVDHTLSANMTMSIPQNALSVETTFSALADARLEGWETIIFTTDPGEILSVVDYRSPFMAFVRDNVTNPELLSDTDTDGDGLSDRWELANGFDPFTPNEANLDADGDGLTNLEEAQAGTNPNAKDSDGNGVEDFVQLNTNPTADPDYVEIRLRTRDTGKVNDGMACAVCHTTALAVNGFQHYSLIHGTASEKSFFVKKGTNYPIYLRDLFRDLPPVQSTGTPTTTAKYDAEILPGTNSPQAFVITGAQTNKLGINKDYATFFPADPTVSFANLTIPKIEVVWSSIAGNVALDANTNAGGGLRVFPDRLSPTDTTARDKVRVTVKTTPPVAGQNVRLKSFDVDDPFVHSSGDPNFLIDPNDRTGEKGDDNKGTPRPGQLLQPVLTLDSQGQASTDFTVTLKAGDNFRIAALLDTSGATTHLDKLQVTNASAAFYVPSGSNQIAAFVGSLSPMLTVWRKLHLEFDSMTTPPATGSEANYTTGIVTSVKLNYTVPGHSQIAVRHTKFAQGGYFLFNEGKLEITGIGTYRITNSYHTEVVAGFSGDYATTVQIEAVPSGSLIGRAAKIFDDDDQFLTNHVLYPSGLDLQSPPLPADQRGTEFVSGMQSRYADAYIYLVNANTNGWNTSPTIPFKRNAPFLTSSWGSVFDAGNLQLKGTDSQPFWAYSVVFAYQASAGQDGDPNGEVPLSGGSLKVVHWSPLDPDKSLGYSVIFLEAIRDHNFGIGRSTVSYTRSTFTNSVAIPALRQLHTNWLYGVTAHEIGHAPGRQTEGEDHSEGNLMIEGADSIDDVPFSPATITRFRSALSWTD